MYRILEKKVLSNAVKSMIIKAPHVARAARPGSLSYLGSMRKEKGYP